MSVVLMTELTQTSRPVAIRCGPGWNTHVAIPPILFSAAISLSARSGGRS